MKFSLKHSYRRREPWLAVDTKGDFQRIPGRVSRASGIRVKSISQCWSIALHRTLICAGGCRWSVCDKSYDRCKVVVCQVPLWGGGSGGFILVKLLSCNFVMRVRDERLHRFHTGPYSGPQLVDIYYTHTHTHTHTHMYVHMHHLRMWLSWFDSTQVSLTSVTVDILNSAGVLGFLWRSFYFLFVCLFACLFGCRSDVLP